MTLIFFYVDSLPPLPLSPWSVFKRVWPNHLTPTRMAMMQKKVKQNQQTKKLQGEKKKKRVGRGYGEIGTLVYYWQKCKVTQSVRKTAWWLLKTIKNWITTRS